MNNYIVNHTFEEIELGDTASIQHMLTYKDIQLFAIMSGDVNPAVIDKEYAESDMFHKIVAHGMWTGSLFSTVLGTLLPGPGTIYISQTLQFLKPVGVGDNITARVTVTSKDAKKKTVDLDCVCINQDGKEVITGKAVVLAPIDKIKRKRVILPDIELKGVKSPHHIQIVLMAKGLAPLLTAVVHPVDKLSLSGALAAAKAKLITPILVGPKAKIIAVAKAEKLDISAFTLISTPHSHASAEMAVQLVREGKAEAIMKGDIHTDELMHPILNKETGLQTERRVSHVSVMDTPAYPKALFVTDDAINIFPTLDAKRDIVQNAIDLFHAIGLGTPKVAILSAVETVNVNIPSTVEASALCKMADRGQITGAILDGPLALDNALSEESAKIKNIQSQVAGERINLADRRSNGRPRYGHQGSSHANQQIQLGLRTHRIQRACPALRKKPYKKAA
jgi:phosphate acetyltransferase